MDQAVQALLTSGDVQGALARATDPWTRAVAAAWAGDRLRVQIALRALTRDGAALDRAEAVRDAALPFARALLDEAPTLPAWRTLAEVVWAPHADSDEPADLRHLAWELLVEATDAVEPTTAARADHVAALGALAWRMGRWEEATPLLRTAQELGRIHRATDALAAATLVFVQEAQRVGDVETAQAHARWGIRVLTELGDAAGAARLREHTGGLS